MTIKLKIVFTQTITQLQTWFQIMAQFVDG